MTKKKTFDMKTAGKAGMALFLLALSAGLPVNAAAATNSITSAFDSIVSSIGQLYLLWGVFEWATALNSTDGSMQSMAFKRIAAGLVACLAPQIIKLIKIS